MTRLVLLILLFLVSLLSVLRAPTYHLWQLSVAVMEFPWIFTGVAILFTIWCLYGEQYRVPGSILGLTSILLFLSPIIRAYIVASELDKELNTAIGDSNLRKEQSPFGFWEMINGTFDKKADFKTFVYNNSDSLSLDYYSSQIKGRRPCVIIVHGGSWSGGDSKQLPELNSYLANKGYHVAAINYRLAPQYQNPAPVEDVQSAIRYLKHRNEELNIDTNNFVLLGRSAGGQIALLAAYTLQEPGLKAVISFYGPADMVWGYSVPSNPLIMDSRKVMEDYLGGTYSKVPKNYATSSPIEFVNKQSVPTLIIHGKNDVLVSYLHSVKLNRKLDDFGVKHFFLSLPWATHGFDYNLKGPGGQLSTYTIEYFLKQVTR